MARAIWTGAGGVLLLLAAWLLALTVFAQIDGPDDGIFARTEGSDLKVIGVVGGSRWAAAGLRTGDLIEAIDGQADALLDRLYAVKIAQQPGGAHRFQVHRDDRTLNLTYTGGPSTAPLLHSAPLAIFSEVLVKIFFLGAAFYFIFFYHPTAVLSRLSGALFLLLAILTPFFQLNLAFILAEFGVTVGRVLLAAMLLVCFLPAVVATLGALLPPTGRPVIRPPFLLRTMLAVLGVLYVSYLYVGQDFIGRLAAPTVPADLLRFFPVFRILNDAFMFLLVLGAVGGLLLMMTHLQRRDAARRMTAVNRVMGVLTLGLALPLVAGFVMMVAGWQFTAAYGLRKLGYILFPLLYIQAVHYFTRRPDDGALDAGADPAR
jgi:hypothetical protein